MDRGVAARAALLARVDGVPGYEAIAAELRGPHTPPRAPSVVPTPMQRPMAEPSPIDPLADLVRACEHRKPIGCACRGDYACGLYQIPATWAECLACVAEG